MRHHPGPLIQAWIDGELPPLEMARVGQHLDTCPECATTLSDLRDDLAAVHQAVQSIDRTEPAAWSETADRSAVPQALPARPGRRILRWAAVIALGVTGAGAAAFVGREVFLGRAGRPGGGEAPVGVVEPAAAGVFMALLLDQVTVVVDGAGEGARVRLTATDRADVSVRVMGAAVVPRFRVEERVGRIVVFLEGGAGTVSVEVPSTLGAGEVRAGDRTVVRFANGRVDPPEAAVTGIPLGPR